MMVGAVAGLYPVVLPSITNANLDITIRQSTFRPAHAPRWPGLVGTWHVDGSGYFIFMYRMFRGKVDLKSTGYGH